MSQVPTYNNQQQQLNMVACSVRGNIIDEQKIPRPVEQQQHLYKNVAPTNVRGKDGDIVGSNLSTKVDSMMSNKSQNQNILSTGGNQHSNSQSGALQEGAVHQEDTIDSITGTSERRVENKQVNEFFYQRLNREAEEIIAAEALDLIEEAYVMVFAAHNNSKSKNWHEIIEEDANAVVEDSMSHVTESVEANKEKELSEEDMEINIVLGKYRGMLHSQKWHEV